MYLREKRIYRYSKLLGEDRPDIKLKLETFKRFPQLEERIEAELLSLLALEGYKISNLPPFPRPLPQDLNGGGINIGSFIQNDSPCGKFFLPLETFDERHTLIAGITGCGKSFLVKLLFCVLTMSGIPCILFDIEDEHSDLLKVLGPEKVWIFDPNNLKMPFTQPIPNCDFEKLWGMFKNVLRECMYCRDGSLNSLDELRAYLNERGNRFPTARDFYNLIRKWKTSPASREFGFLETLENRFRLFLGTPFDGRESCSLEKIPKKSMIIRIGKIKDDMLLKPFVNFFLSLLMLYREYNPWKGPTTPIFLEESHRYFYRKIEDRADLSEPILFQIARQCRKRGYSLIFVDHCPHLLFPQIFANISNFFIFSLPDYRDVQAVGFPMGLDEEQVQAIPELGPRDAIVKSDKKSQPYMVRVRHFESIPIGTRELEEFSRRSLQELGPLMSAPEPARPYACSEEVKKRFINLWHDYLMHALENPELNRNQRKKDLGLGQWEMTKLVDDLKRNDFIKEHRISFGKEGNPGVFDEVLKAGFDYVGAAFKPLRGRGDYPHCLIQYMISKQVKGTVELRGADVGWMRKDGESIAIEVEMNPENREELLKNIRRDLDSGFLKVWVVCRNESEREKIQYIIETWLDFEDHEKVDVKLLRQLI
jgi:hypothetical protein